MATSKCKDCGLKSAATKTLDSNELDILEHNCAQVQFNIGDTIFKQDALSSNVIYLKTGLVKIHIMGPLKEKILKLAKAPAYLSLPSTFGDKVNHFSATAIEKTTACFIDVNVFRKFIYANGDFAFQVILELSKNELQNFHNCVNHIQKQTNGRVAAAILLFAEEIYASNTFSLPLTRLDFGDLVGTSRENVCRILTEFSQEKIIYLKGREITLLNKERLNQISMRG